MGLDATVQQVICYRPTPAIQHNVLDPNVVEHRSKGSDIRAKSDQSSIRRRNTDQNEKLGFC